MSPSIDLYRLQRDLTMALDGTVAVDSLTRGMYATDASHYQIFPQAVVCPRHQRDVEKTLAVARDWDIPVLARGGGTSLAGQTVAAAIVIDFSRYMNEILEVNPDEGWARVQPGVVRDDLNAEVAEYGLHFAPDPATSSRANIGGMVANNSSGTRSIVYGRTIDHLAEVTAVLSTGETVHWKEMSERAWRDREERPGREGEILRQIRQAIEPHRDEIVARYPKVMRRVNGYPLDAFARDFPWNPAHLLCGSEGTLALLTECKVTLEPLPQATSLVVLHFDSLSNALESVVDILPHQPSTVELLDRSVIDRVRENLALAHHVSLLKGTPEGLLLVEFSGDSLAEVEERGRKLAHSPASNCYAAPIYTDEVEKQRVWSIRKNGLGLMLGRPGEKKPQAFVEDACIPVEKLAGYIEEMREFCRSRGVEAAVYAHASVGVIHVRPFLNLKDPADIATMQSIARFSFDKVVEYGGSWSGEHGDGLVRSPFLAEFFGPTIYQVHREVKALFDPVHLLNPGKIVDPPKMDENLRYGRLYRGSQVESQFHYRREGGFGEAVEMCNGVGACRKKGSGTMCPSFMVTRDERDSTRGRANALRLAMSGQLGSQAFTSKEMYEVLDLCVSCKGCKAECPSNVDVARMKSDFLYHYRRRWGTSLRDRLACHFARMARYLAGSWSGRLANWFHRQKGVRYFLEKTLGLARQRVLPPFAPGTLVQWWEKRGLVREREGRSVALFVDTYLNYFEPQVGRAAVELLESCGYQVHLAEVGCCQRPRISQGFLDEAKGEAPALLAGLAGWIDQGMKVVVVEPSCASALTDDLPDLVDEPDLETARKVAKGCVMIDVFLRDEWRSGKGPAGFTAPADQVLVHGHCHQKALYSTEAMKEILEEAGCEVEEVDSGCCGMAGLFGYEAEHYEISQRMGEDRLFPAVRSCGDKAVVACGFSCRHQIVDGTGVEARHWVEVVRGR